VLWIQRRGSSNCGDYVHRQNRTGLRSDHERAARSVRDEVASLVETHDALVIAPHGGRRRPAANGDWGHDRYTQDLDHEAGLGEDDELPIEMVAQGSELRVCCFIG
jgi:hypothetical protein